MALSGFQFVTSEDVGAPTMAGVNGSANDWYNYYIVTVLGGTRPYHNAGTNESVFQFPNGQYLYVCHDSALSGSAQRYITRMAEGASGYSYSDLVNPYPTQAQVADTSCNSLASTTANATARAHRAVIWDGGISGAVQVDGTWWLPIYYGEAHPTDPTDLFCNICTVRYSATAGIGSGFWSIGGSTNSANGTLTAFFNRSIDGLVVSTTASRLATYGVGDESGGSSLSNAVAGKVVHEPIILKCSGSASTAADASKNRHSRALLYNQRRALHDGIGSYSDADYFTDGNYAPGCILRPLYSGGYTYGILLQETDDWSPA